jgi:hypothetical protein
MLSPEDCVTLPRPDSNARTAIRASISTQVHRLRPDPGGGSPPCPIRWSPTTRPPPRRDLPAAGHHLRRDGRGGAGQGPAVPAGPRPADPAGARVGPHRARPRATHPRAQPLHRRRLPRARDRPGRDRPVAADRQPLALRARRPRGAPAWRRVLPRRRLRSGPRRRRLVEGPGGQRPHALRHLLRVGEPRRDDAPGPAALPASPRAAGRPLPAAPAGGPALGRAERRGRGHRRGLDARLDELRLLRARVPRAADGGRARRGIRPRRARRRALHAHDGRAAPRARRVPVRAHPRPCASSSPTASPTAPA